MTDITIVCHGCHKEFPGNPGKALGGWTAHEAKCIADRMTVVCHGCAGAFTGSAHEAFLQLLNHTEPALV